MRDGLIVRLSTETARRITAHLVDAGGGDIEFAFGSLWGAGLQGQRFAVE